MIIDKNLCVLKDRIIEYLKESRDISPEEEKRISDDSLTKTERAVIYLDFFKKNASASADIKGKRILDFGSGDGVYAMEFSKAGASVAGIDIDSVLVRITQEFAKQICLNTQFVSYHNGKIPYGDDYFDYCYCLNTLEHLETPVDSLREIYRVLKKDGILHIAFPNRFYPYDAHSQLFFVPWLSYNSADFMVRLCKKHNLKHYSNLHFYSYRQFKRFLDKSKTNFSIIIKEKEDISFIKKIVIEFLHAFNIHHTILTQNISILLKK